jgi:hypothetical protein
MSALTLAKDSNRRGIYVIGDTLPTPYLAIRLKTIFFSNRQNTILFACQMWELMFESKGRRTEKDENLSFQ